MTASMHFAAIHPACGTRVRTELPFGYPLDEGVGLYCPTCQQAWWEEPRPEPAPAEPAVASPGAPSDPTAAPDPIAAPVLTAAAPPPVPVAATPRPVAAVAAPALVVAAGPRPAPPPPGMLRRWWPAGLALAAFMILATVVAVSAISPSTSPSEADARPLSTPSPPAAAPTAAPTPAAPVTRTVSRRVANRRLTATLGEGWSVRRHRTGLTYAGPGGAQVRVSMGPRNGRDLGRLGRDARRALDAPRAKLRRTSLSGVPAVAVRGRGQEIVQMADGRRRWLISRPSDAGAPIVRSLRMRPVA